MSLSFHFPNSTSTPFLKNHYFSLLITSTATTTRTIFPFKTLAYLKPLQSNPYKASPKPSILSDSLRVLEWDKVCDSVASFAGTSLGREATKAQLWAVDRSYDESKNLLAETNAVVELMKYGAGGVDFSGLDVGRVKTAIDDASRALPVDGLEALAVSSLLQFADILQSTLKVAIKEDPDRYNRFMPLTEVIMGFVINQPLVKSVQQVIDEDGTVKDSASADLRRHREQVRMLERKMSGGEAPRGALADVDQPDYERRLQRFLQAFLASQEAQATAHQQQAQDFAQFQTQVLEVIERVAQPAPVDVPIRGADPNVIFEKFLKRGPPEFTGAEDPMVADDWLIRMEKIFRVFECSGRQQVQLAAYMFRGVAEDWWRTIQRHFEMIGDEIAWTAFRADFLRKFIPAHVRDRKLREFQALVQGSMTVYQYEVRFTQLSRFAEALVTPESERIRRFVDGLREEIQMGMTCLEITTYEEALRRAYWAEEHLQRIEVKQQQKRLRIVPIGQQPVVQQQQQPFRRQRPVGQAGQYRHHQQQYREPRVCFECGEQGHISRFCPLLRQQPPMLQLPAPPRASAPAAQPVRQIAPAPQLPQQQYRAPQQARAPQQPRGQHFQQGHHQRQYGQRHQQQRPRAAGQAFALTHEEAEAAGNVVEGLDPDLDDDALALVAAPVVGDYGWGPADQVVAPEVGEPAQGEE